MSHSQILIIGAGAAGLLAARELSFAGKAVVVLEGGARVGGRILDEDNPDWPVPIALGAEFIHGELALTFDLLKEAGLTYTPMEQKGVRLHNGEQVAEEKTGLWTEFMDRLNTLEADQTLTDFLTSFFSDSRYAALKDEVLRFVQGYDAADPETVSVLSLRDEWSDDATQYRVDNGYGQLVHFLVSKCHEAGCSIRLHKVVTHIRWENGFVEAYTSNGESFTADQLIVTVPPGVLRIPPGHAGSIVFEPSLIEQERAIQRIGFGAVIKVIIRFKSVFWSEMLSPDTTFLFSEGPVPTWWLHSSSAMPILYGWIAGPQAAKYDYRSDKSMVEMAVNTLASAFGLPTSFIADQLEDSYIFNWNTNPFSKGGYTFTTLEGTEAIQVLREGIQNTIYFAGEAIYQGPHGGTVEAALISGRDVARQILNN